MQAFTRACTLFAPEGILNVMGMLRQLTFIFGKFSIVSINCGFERRVLPGTLGRVLLRKQFDELIMQIRRLPIMIEVSALDGKPAAV